MASVYDDLDRPPLNAQALRRALVTEGSVWTDLEVVDETPSTNALLVERAARGEAAGIVVLAEHQTAGRGRLDRTWTAPPRSGLTMSMLVRPRGVDVARWPWLPLLSGLAVAAAVRQEAKIDACVKWPNDVVVGDHKLAGILVERVETVSGDPAAVIGVGLNVSLRRDELPIEGATSLALEGATTTDRSLLARAVLRQLEGLLRQWERSGGDARQGLHSAYVDACATLGRHVQVSLPNGNLTTGLARGIDTSGRLLVRTAQGEEAFGAGDVLHLRPQT